MLTVVADAASIRADASSVSHTNISSVEFLISKSDLSQLLEATKFS
jgi:hypothetical protein